MSINVDWPSIKTPTNAKLFEKPGSHDHECASGSDNDRATIHNRIAAASDVATARIETYAAGFPARRNGNNTAISRNDATGARRAMSARVIGSLNIAYPFNQSM
jgi:hypothetical protein